MNDFLQSLLLTKEKPVNIRIAVITGLVQNRSCGDKIEQDVNGCRVLLKNNIFFPTSSHEERVTGFRKLVHFV